jgi:cellulose biosynthesis protein BcsQ
MACTIALASGKGGVGRSMVGVTASSMLAQRYTVGLVDLDPEAYATTMGLAQPPASDPLSAPGIRITHPRHESAQLTLWAGGEALDSASEVEMDEHVARCAAAVDVLVIDTPPARRSPTVRAALRAASVVVVPMLADFQAFSGYEKILATCAEIGVSAPVRVLFTRWDQRTRLAADVQQQLGACHPGAAVAMPIPRDQRVPEAAAFGVPAPWFAPSSRAVTAMRTALYEIAGSGGLQIPRGAI